VIPRLESLVSRMLWLQVSKAFFRSQKIRRVCFFELSDVVMWLSRSDIG